MLVVAAADVVAAGFAAPSCEPLYPRKDHALESQIGPFAAAPAVFFVECVVDSSVQIVGDHRKRSVVVVVAEASFVLVSVVAASIAG